MLDMDFERGPHRGRSREALRGQTGPEGCDLAFWRSRPDGGHLVWSEGWRPSFPSDAGQWGPLPPAPWGVQP